VISGAPRRRAQTLADGVSRRTLVGFAMAALAAPTARAADASERRAVARRLAEVVRREYQDPASAEAMADAIGARLSRGAYDAALGDDAFAATLTADLRAVTPDPHMAVMANVDAGAPKLSADPVYSLRQNYGVQGVRRLGGNVGVIELNFAPHLGFADAILERYAAAMALVRDTRALIVDLRAHIGGEPATIAYFVSYFFERAPFVVNRIRYRNQPTVDYSTVAVPRGPKYGETRPVFVLTSARTFSAGEELAYDLQSTGRARVVGSRTGGGAHPDQAFDIGRGFAAFIPIGAAVNPVTGGNWERVGVKPDSEVEAGKALDVAWRLALEAARAQAESVDERKSIDQAIAALPK
jgi:Peptidase family S41/N-terminal domain of Peptidase_S41 in eukaryotic IRBP